MSDIKLPIVKKPRAKKVQLSPTTSYLTEDKSYCLSCRVQTPNASDTFKLERYKSNWGLTLRCAECGKSKHKFLSKGETSHLPEDLRNSEVGTIINKEDYESKYGGILPLLALLPLIFGGIGAASAVAGTTAGVVIEKQKADEASRHNQELEKIARGNGIQKTPKTEEQRIKKYVDFLAKRGFGFHY
jgi:hypothetical protein